MTLKWMRSQNGTVGLNIRRVVTWQGKKAEVENHRRKCVKLGSL